MDMTMFAKIFGPTLIFFGLYTIFLRGDRTKITKHFENNKAVHWLEASISMVIGLGIINAVKYWGSGYQVLIPIYGWICFIRGVLILFLANQFQKLWSNMPNRIMIAAVRICFGLAFVCVGYFS